MDGLRLRLRLRLRLLVVLLVISSASAVNKVKLDLYYESLCPYCSNLIVNYLPKLFDSDLISITDLRLFPYGNAWIYPDGVWCQHGPNECLLNTVEACAIDAWPDLKDHFPFIYCVENLAYQHNYTYWETCFDKLSLDASPVLNCYKSDHGKELLLRYGAVTSSLEPPHTYVPWVVVDGQPLYDDYEDFASFICKAYKGTDKPSACSKSLVGGIQKTVTKLINYLYGEVPKTPKVSFKGHAMASKVQRKVTTSL